jgi:hypothetical protein
VKKLSTRNTVIVLFVVVSCISVGASTLLTGEFHLHQSAGNSLIADLEGPAAYLVGLLFIGVGALGAASLFRS